MNHNLREKINELLKRGKRIEEIEANSQAVLGLDLVIANSQPYFGQYCMRSFSGDGAAAKIARR